MTPLHAHRTAPRNWPLDPQVAELAQVIADWINAREGDEQGHPPAGWDIDLARHILARYSQRRTR